MYNLKVKKLNDDVIIFNFVYKGDVGMDLYFIEEVVIFFGEIKFIKIGICIEFFIMIEVQVRFRSGFVLKYFVIVLNILGIIDEGYRGEFKIILINYGKNDFKVEKYMKIV